jgi:VIT1/CCC1 family predicted Fe2+/Mn2+ transporter
VVLRRVRGTDCAEEARGLIADALPTPIAPLLTPGELDALRERILVQEPPPPRIPVTRADIRGACAVFLLVFLSTFPIVVPFLFAGCGVGFALRVSNGIAIAILYVVGSRLGRYIGCNSARMGVSLVLVGAALVALAMALGG